MEKKKEKIKENLSSDEKIKILEKLYGIHPEEWSVIGKRGKIVSTDTEVKEATASEATASTLLLEATASKDFISGDTSPKIVGTTVPGFAGNSSGGTTPKIAGTTVPSFVGNIPRPTAWKQQAPYQKEWYNKDLEISNPEIYKSIDNMWRSISPMDRVGSYHLTQLEKVVLNLLKDIQSQKEGYQKAKIVIENIANSNKTSASQAMQRKKENSIQGTSPLEKQLRSTILSIDLHDLINIRIKDFLELIKVFKFTNEKIIKMESDLLFEDLIEKYQHGYLPAEDLINIIKGMKEDDLERLLQSDNMIKNKNGKYRRWAYYDNIVDNHRNIMTGLVHIIFLDITKVNIYEKQLPSICFEVLRKKQAKKFWNHYQINIWSIFEEKHYTKQYQSVQLWEIRTLMSEPTIEEVNGKEILFDMEDERYCAAQEFFEEFWIKYDKCPNIYHQGNIILFDFSGDKVCIKEDKKQFITKTFEKNNLGPIGAEVKEMFFSLHEIEDSASLISPANSIMQED